MASLSREQELAKDANVAPDGTGFQGLRWHTTRATASEVDSVLADAVAAGAKLLKPAQEAFWGGYSGYFSDPDGFLWEVAWNPTFPIAADGSIRLPD